MENVGVFDVVIVLALIAMAVGGLALWLRGGRVEKKADARLQKIIDDPSLPEFVREAARKAQAVNLTAPADAIAGELISVKARLAELERKIGG